MAKVMLKFKDGGTPEQLAKDLGLLFRNDMLYQIVTDEDQKDCELNIGYVVSPKSMPGIRVVELRSTYIHTELVRQARELPYVEEISFPVQIGGA